MGVTEGEAWKERQKFELEFVKSFQNSKNIFVDKNKYQKAKHKRIKIHTKKYKKRKPKKVSKEAETKKCKGEEKSGKKEKTQRWEQKCG